MLLFSATAVSVFAYAATCRDTLLLRIDIGRLTSLI
jgi:hypothetical protein